MNNLFKIIILIMISISCGDSKNYDVLETAEIDNSPHYTVFADIYLKENNKVAILRALNEWAEKTNNTLVYDIQYVDMSKQTETYKYHTIKIYVKDIGADTIGFSVCQRAMMSSIIYIDPGINDDYFRRVTLHELGHAFNLSFDKEIHYSGPYKSIMTPGINEASEHVECPELLSFCNNYRCQVDCEFILNKLPSDGN